MPDILTLPLTAEEPEEPESHWTSKFRVEVHYKAKDRGEAAVFHAALRQSVQAMFEGYQAAAPVKLEVDLYGTQVPNEKQAPPPPEPYYELQASDVGKAFIRAFDKTWVVTNFMGRILHSDVGKRVYQRGSIIQVENDEQRSRRLNEEPPASPGEGVPGGSEGFHV